METDTTNSTETRLGKILARIKLKELEVIEKLQDNFASNSKMMRSLISPNQHHFVAVNGDWEEILGYTEDDCRGNGWEMIVPAHEAKRGKEFIDKLKDVKEGFSEFHCDIITKSGTILKSAWKLKYIPDLNLVISIGRLV